MTDTNGIDLTAAEKAHLQKEFLPAWLTGDKNARQALRTRFAGEITKQRNGGTPDPSPYAIPHLSKVSAPEQLPGPPPSLIRYTDDPVLG